MVVERTMRAERPARADREGRTLGAQVYTELAAGGFRSGAVLARRLGVTRNAIWKAVRSLHDLGLTIHAVPRRGYRMPVPCEPLDAAAIRAALSAESRRRVRRLEVVWSVESTNAALLARSDVPQELADVLVAEYQTAGRGRLGRTWLAPPGGSICLSIGWTFPELPAELPALGLAVGVCTLRALRSHVSRRLALKWPNDLVLEDSKLGGILIEMRAESAGPAYVVIGIGLNLALGAQLLEQIVATGTRAGDLASAGADPLRRNALTGRLATETIEGLVRFRHEGLRPFLDEWRAADSLCGRAVTIRSAQSSWRGIARGIDESGALLVETPRGLQRVLSGDVSVRSVEERAPDSPSDAAACGNASSV